MEWNFQLSKKKKLQLKRKIKMLVNNVGKLFGGPTTTLIIKQKNTLNRKIFFILLLGRA